MKLVIFNAKGKHGYQWRYRYWKKRLKNLGENVRIEPNVEFIQPSCISIADNVWIDRNVVIVAGIKDKEVRKNIELTIEHFDSRLEKGHVFIDQNTHIAINVVILGLGGVVIGKNTGIASGSCIYSISHHYKNLLDPSDLKQYSFTPMAEKSEQFMIYGPVVISDNCAVGLSTVILPGVHVGEGAWIGANSIVKSSIPSQSVYSGGPKPGKDISKYRLH